MLAGVNKSLGPMELAGLKKLGKRVNSLGMNFAVCDVEGRVKLLCEGERFKSSDADLRDYSLELLSSERESSEAVRVEVAEDDRPAASAISKQENCGLVGQVLDSGYGASGTAIIDAGSQSQIPVSRVYLSEFLSLGVQSFAAESKSSSQIEQVSNELSDAYEELVLLHKLSMNMKVTETDSNFLQMACDGLTDIISVEGIAILLLKEVDGHERLSLAAGSGLIDIDENMEAILYDRLLEEMRKGKDSLLDSEVDSPFRYRWPENIESIVAVPLCAKDNSEMDAEDRAGGDNVIGLLVAVNRIDKQDFDSTDAKLFNSVASSCAVFVENGRLFRDFKELFLGSLRALTTSIDAKDRYTRGHSERVAFISRWIAERYAEREGELDQAETDRIYLAGLLHDLGKMGINESVLRKEGKLTDAEYEQIRMHPSIGAGILSSIKQMRDIVPGVLCHHERADGKGYPNGVKGDEMPLTGKIVSLADSFDAMTSKRTYRDAMTIEQALAEIENGLGAQFDEKVGRIFLDSDVYTLWDIIQEGIDKVYGRGSLTEYGTTAVGALLR